MNTLHETQRRFTNYALRNLGQALATEGIKGNGLDVAQRLAIYRNNTQLGLTEALRDGYPVVNKLVGTEFFNHLALSFIRHYPPKAGCLLSFGGQFADFIADFQPAEGLPYLPDTARLEWFWHEAFHEADVIALDITRLAKVDPNCYGNLGFTLHPSARLLASDYPVLRIWQANQEGFEGEGRINFDEGGCQLLIYRPVLEVEIIPLSKAEHLFLTLLDMELTVTQAVGQAITIDSTFEVLPVLQHWIANGLLTDFYIKN
ncbi:hypothetical protein MGMO_17c00090 [Methyloglobulus morosus KoM1]|uniref:Putative DNA-binding domain-containing protein n=1 Tax=Methyloglobulus morosus KoM1 TaxID=1116472 RepID=V5C0F8_9GAMM|nr:DNA-binding domain-containing protein [Methyloglobulus morosus]ESS73544.1 hypothetical protein MGMO_17c00090 [Methyloglobulus morosus KoM1]